VTDCWTIWFVQELRAVRQTHAAKVRHPDGKGIGLIEERRSGDIRVQVFEQDGVHWSLELFDGTRFLPDGQPQITARVNLRSILEARNGDIRLGSVVSLGRIDKENFQTIGAKKGFADSGVFSAIERSEGKILLGGRESLTDDGKSFARCRRRT
jgi:hypothetical protein